MNMSEPTQFSKSTLRGELRTQVAMSKHTSWRAGGCVDRLYKPADLADLQNFVRSVSPSEPLIAVGLGSNLLVRDGGLRGTVVLTRGALNELRMENEQMIYVQAGVAGAKLARFTAANHLAGGEFFAGIPGTVGGMLTMNAGCYGGETWRLVERVQVLTRTGQLIERQPTEYVVGYRCAQLKSLPDSNEIFVGAWLRFQPSDGDSAQAEIKAMLEKRQATQPLNLPNAGSVFRNPPDNFAAKLIESCGLKKMQIGGAQVSEKHANFIVNIDAASAADIENLINEVQSVVLEKTGIELHPEVRIIGEYEKHE
jgi:UDP-N-acetylmuramate dehydrogenase